jgi:hypothetical protein
MRVTVQTCCPIQRISCSLRYVNCGPGHIQSIFSTVYLGFNIQMKVAPLLFEVSRRFNGRYTANLVPNTAHILPVYAMWTVVPAIYNVVTSPHIQSSVCNWSYLRCYRRYLDNSMRVILQTGSHIQRTSSGLHYVNCGPGHIDCNYYSAYSGFNIQLNVTALLSEISRQVNAL